ncbi:unnamed protein product [Rotaria sp. Silwood1]|nr:unnamed protein product [Rotaria sp. Silwood1]
MQDKKKLRTSGKPKSCEYADSSKAFSNSSDRTKHIKRTHLNKKKYKCQIQGCGKSNTDYSCTSPYEYDCISNDNIKYETRSNNALTILSVQISLMFKWKFAQLLTSSHVNLITSHLSSILTNELSPSSSFCVSALSGGIQQTSISNSNPKITHLIYLCQKLEYN